MANHQTANHETALHRHPSCFIMWENINISSSLDSRLAIPMRCTKSKAVASIYGSLSLTFVRSCARYPCCQELDLHRLSMVNSILFLFFFCFLCLCFSCDISTIIIIIIHNNENTRMEIIMKYNMLLPIVLYLKRTVYRQRDRMAREFALTRAKLSLPYISLLTSDLGRSCLVDKRVASLDSACIALVPPTSIRLHHKRDTCPA